MESAPTATSNLTAKSIEELFPLIEYCRAGDLRQVAQWIQQGKPLNPPPGKKTKRRTPLQVAIEKGFLTLAENLLEAGADPMANGNALMFAIDHRRADIAALLIDRGSAVDPDLFVWACSSGDPETMRVFLNRGADPIKGFPFYHGFTSCLQPALGVYKEYVEKVPELKEQADMALCHYAKEGNLRCVSLLLWAGARPDREVLNAENPNQEYRNYCALVEAASAGHVDVLRRMKPENFPEMHTALVGACWHRNTADIMELLQKTNVDLQLTQENAIRALEHLLWQLGWDTDPSSPFGSQDPGRTESTIQRMEYLIKKGLKWVPDPERGVRDSRQHFRKLAPEKILRIFRLFKEHQVVGDEFLEALVNTTAMRAHLTPKFANAIHDLFHPPERKLGDPAEAPESLKPTPVAKPTLPQLRGKAEEFFWDLVRNIPSIRFWESETQESLSTREFGKYLGIEKDDEDVRLHEIAKVAVDKINQRAGTFQLHYEGNEYRQTLESVKIQLKESSEWGGVIAESWKSADAPPPRFLTRPALDLFRWLKEEGFPKDWMKDRTLSWKAGLHGKLGVVENHLWELQQKLGDGFCFESRGTKWNGDGEHRIWIEGEVSLEGPTPRRDIPKSLNPVMDLDFNRCNKNDFDRWRDFVHRHLLESKPVGTTPVYIFWIEKREELHRIFPHFTPSRYKPGAALVQFWDQVQLADSIRVECDFRGRATSWFLRVHPKENWEACLVQLEELARQPTLSDKYGLSAEAAKLLEWIESIRPEDYEGKWTPVVEEADEKEIGLVCPWDNDDNFPAFLQLLIDEINEKTPYALALQPWRSHSDVTTRIRVEKKKSDEVQLIRQIQLLGLSQGKSWSEDRVRAILADLGRA
jgi:Ankyrin repeats (3 copies)